VAAKGGALDLGVGELEEEAAIVFRDPDQACEIARLLAAFIRREAFSMSGKGSPTPA
jgi:hypothetical protein